jgi:hypothetical protein
VSAIAVAIAARAAGPAIPAASSSARRAAAEAPGATARARARAGGVVEIAEAAQPGHHHVRLGASSAFASRARSCASVRARLARRRSASAFALESGGASSGMDGA